MTLPSRIAFTTAAAKTGLQQFHRALNTPLREALHRHGADLLRTAGIDEPLTWSPPADCVAGLALPGREPADIDLTALRQLLDVERVTVTTAARRLDVTAEHVRYAQQQLHRPPDSPRPAILDANASGPPKCSPGSSSTANTTSPGTPYEPSPPPPASTTTHRAARPGPRDHSR